jgi:hypothetical protein
MTSTGVCSSPNAKGGGIGAGAACTKDAFGDENRLGSRIESVNRSAAEPGLQRVMTSGIHWQSQLADVPKALREAPRESLRQRSAA